MTNLVGKRFGARAVLELVEPGRCERRHRVRSRCDCGAVSVVQVQTLIEHPDGCVFCQRAGALMESVLKALSTHTARRPLDVLNRVREDYGSINGSQVYRTLPRLARRGLAIREGRDGGPPPPPTSPWTRYRLSPEGKRLLDKLMGWVAA